MSTCVTDAVFLQKKLPQNFILQQLMFFEDGGTGLSSAAGSNPES